MLLTHTERMRERAPAGWSFTNMESLAQWAEELSNIQSSKVTQYRKALVQCESRLVDLARKIPVTEPDTAPSRKSIRVQKKAPVEATASSSTGIAPLKTGDTYVNATKVCFVLSKVLDADNSIVRPLPGCR